MVPGSERANPLDSGKPESALEEKRHESVRVESHMTESCRLTKCHKLQLDCRSGHLSVFDRRRAPSKGYERKLQDMSLFLFPVMVGVACLIERSSRTASLQF